MNTVLKGLKQEQNFTETANGAVAYKSTLNACLDAFATLGAAREMSDEFIIRTFANALNENPELAMKLLFYIRDARGGQGERKTFRTIVKWLAGTSHSDKLVKNLPNFLYYGRADDLLCLLDTPIKKEVLDFIDLQLETDLRGKDRGLPISMLAKWLPSENASSKETVRYAKIVRQGLHLTSRDYRKILTALRGYLKVVETKMSANCWSSIDYQSVPAKAALNYGNAFYRHDKERYYSFIRSVAEGKAKINAETLYPSEILHILKRDGEPRPIDEVLCDVLWENLPNYFNDKKENGICVVDVSGSMYGRPIEVAVSLGIYCAEKSCGPFKNHFITFSDCPELVEIKGKTLSERVRNIEDTDWGYTTNLEAVFDLILSVAVKNGCPQNDMPKKLYIISDMQFDAAIGYQFFSLMGAMEKKYRKAGYIMPAIVYWNVNTGECGMFQDTFDGVNCCMVSGYSPSLFKAVLEGTVQEEITVVKANGEKETFIREKIDPMEMMLNTLNSERYSKVVIDF